MNDDHPLVRYIHSLTTALNTHPRTHPHILLLSRQITILNQELSALRAHSTSLPTSTDAALKLDQLSLALRTLNEKLEFTERLLLDRTKEVHHAAAEVAAAKSAMDAAYDLVESLYAKEREYLAIQTELQTKLRLEEEKNKANELVIQEYAALVRKLEGRPSSLPSPSKEDHHIALDHLSSEFQSQTTALQHQLSTSHQNLSLLQTQLDAQTKANQTLLSQLSKLQLEMDKYQRDDNTASKMVARYMKFSQQTTNTLQTTLTSLQSRHTSTLTSYTSQIHLLQTHLQNTLLPSHLHTQLLKESFGRRQETKFRLHLLRREEKLVEELKRWLRRNEERLSVLQDDDDEGEGDAKGYFMEMIQDAKIIVDHIDDPIQVDERHPPVSGSLARFVTVQSTVQDLLERLHWEQERRMELEELVGCGVEEDGKGEGERKLDLTESGRRVSSSSNNAISEESTAHSVIVEPRVDDESSAKESTESGIERIYPLSSSSTNDLLEESTPHISERLPDDSVVEPKADVAQDVEPLERTYPFCSSYTNDINDLSEEATAHTLKRLPDNSIVEPKVDESSAKETTEAVVEHIHPLSSSHTNNINNVSKESTARIPQRLPDDSIAEPKVDVSQKVESLPKEQTESVVERTDERIHPLSSSYTNDLSEESTAYVQVPILVIVEPKEDNVSERGDTAKDEVKVVVDEKVKDTVINMAKDEGKAVINEEVKDQPEKKTGDTQLEVDPSFLPSSPPSSSPPSENIRPPHPLLESLHQTRNRYTHTQNSFHDCHIALENLKSHLTSSSSSPHTVNRNPNIPYESIRTIVQRLDDYTEDVRVELEIRILDEEVLGRGYETLLMMCGGGGGGGSEEWNEEEVLAFVNGTDPVIAKALKGFEKKLKDLEEDVAVVKKVVYSYDDDDGNGDDDEDEDDNHKLKKKIISTPESLSTDTLVASPTPGWISSWISPSRSTTPIPQLQPPSHLPNLTFGKIMTNRPRLLSTSSSNLNSGSILRRTVSSLGLSSSHNHLESSHYGGIHSRMTTGDVLKVLQLKTSMPELLVNRNELDVTEEEEDNNNNNNTNNANGVPFKPGLVSTFSSLGSTTPITATLKSSSFALGMGMGMRGRGGGGGGGGNRGLRGGRGMLGSVGLDDERTRRRVVSAAAAAPARSTVLKKFVDGGDKGKDVGKEDVD